MTVVLLDSTAHPSNRYILYRTCYNINRVIHQTKGHVWAYTQHIDILSSYIPTLKHKPVSLFYPYNPLACSSDTSDGQYGRQCPDPYLIVIALVQCQCNMLIMECSCELPFPNHRCNTLLHSPNLSRIHCKNTSFMLEVGYLMQP